MPMESKSEEERILKNVTKLSMFSVLRDTMKKASLLVLTGRQGTGKTTIAKCLRGSYPKKKCIIVRIKKAELNYNSPQVSYIIVDSSEKVSAFDQSIRTYLKNIKATKLIIVSEDIPPNLTTFLKEFANQTDVIFDLNNKDFYNNRDKKNVLKLHMKLNNIYSEDEMTQLQSVEDSEAVCVENSLFDDLLSEETLLGFPKMCALLCSHKDHIRQGITYFRQPPALLIKEIDDLREKGKSDEISAIKYCLFVSVLLCNNMSLIFDLKSSITKSMIHLYPNRTVSCGVNVIQTIAFHLMPRYFKSSKLELKFSNSRIYQAVLIKYCNTHPQPIFGKCNMGDILLFLRPPKYQPLKDEMVLTVQVKDTQLMQLIFNHIRCDQTYTYQFRLRFYHEYGEYARCQNVELDAYYLAWEYVSIKGRENEDELNIFKEQIFACSSGVIGNVLNTLVDKFGNTLLHYFVIWNDKVEKNIIDALLLSAKEDKEDQGLANVWESSNLENAKKHTPLHFAVFFGRDNLLKNFKTMKGIAHSKETLLSSLYNYFCKVLSNEKENLTRLLQSGMEHVSEEIKNDRDLVIVFETGLIPSLSAVKFGKTGEFDHILSILQEGI